MPQLNTNAIPPNTSRARTFAGQAGCRHPQRVVAPQRPRFGIGPLAVITLALMAVVLGGSLIGSLEHTSPRPLATPPSLLPTVEQSPAPPPLRPAETFAAQRLAQHEATPISTIAPVVPAPANSEPQRVEPVMFHSTEPSEMPAIPIVTEPPRPVIVESPPPALGLRIVSMRGHKHHLLLPTGRVIRTFDVGRLCDDLLTARGHAAVIPAANPGDGRPRLDVEMVRCSTIPLRGTNLYSATVTLHLRWFDAAGRERHATFVNGRCRDFVPYDEAVGGAAKSAVDGVMDLLLDCQTGMAR